MIRLIRWLLAMPSPSLLAMGPAHYGRAERRYLKLRAQGEIDEAFLGSDIVARFGGWEGPPE